MGLRETHEAQEQRALEVLHLRHDESRPGLTWAPLHDGNSGADPKECGARRGAGHDCPYAEGPLQADLLQERVQHQGEHET